MRILFLTFWAIIAALPVSASTEVERFALQNDLDHVWTMTAAGLVFSMQAGFLFLEAGSVRSKNSINVAHKNLTDFALSAFLFGLVGFSIMFGTSQFGLFGLSGDMMLFGFEGDWTMTFFVFQMMFAGTAATIVSGATAERTSMLCYVIVTVLIATLVYPVVGHWAWGGLLNGQETPWLQKLGFMDFAGSTVVHSVGAWVALAAIMIIGPRTGRFNESGKPQKMPGHSPIMATFGVLILWMGWIGFNGGSTTAGTGEFALIVTNTMIAGSTGALVQSVMGFFRSGGLHRPEWLINGSLSGLVAITAGCAYVSPQAAILIGALGAVTCYFAARLLVTLRLDDPLSAISVHGFAGVTGTILTAVFAAPEHLLADTRLMQVGIQIIGVGVVFAYTFGLTYVCLRIADTLLPAPDGSRSALRVSEKDETEGLNVAEHDAPLGNTGLVRAMAAILEDPEARIEPIHVEPGEESYEASVLFNQIADRIQNRAARETELLQTTSNLILADLGETMRRVSDGHLAARMSPVIEGPFKAVPEDVNQMISNIDDLVSQVAQSSNQLDATARTLLEQSLALSDAQREQAETLRTLAQDIVAMRASFDKTGVQIEHAQGQAAKAQSGVANSVTVSRGARERINKSSAAVEQIVKAVDLIDDVAFETRLLSLNASVEAARAQDGSSANSGFAVVAQEVRNLAAESARAASEIGSLVNDVNAEIKEAVSGVTTSDDALEGVHANIDGSVELIRQVDAMGRDARQSLEHMEAVLLALSERSTANQARAQSTSDAAHDLKTAARESRALLERYDVEETTKKAA